MSLRSIPIRIRLLLVVAVPTVALLGAVVREAESREATAVASRTELHRTEAVEVLSEVQASAAIPDVVTTRQRIRQQTVSPLVRRVMDAYTQAMVSRYHEADDLRRTLDGPARRLIPDSSTAAFDRQRQAFDALLAADAGTTFDPGLLTAATEARAAADRASAELSLGSASDAWIVYYGATDAIRSGESEFAVVLPTLLGYQVASPTELAHLAGVRASATERVLLAVAPEVRQQAETVLASEPVARWLRAGADAQAVAAGTAPPRGSFELITLLTDATQLDRTIRDIADQAVVGVRDDLAARADRADTERRNLLAFAGVLVGTTVLLSVWILRSISVPLHRLTQRAAAVAAGELGDGRMEPGGRDELTRLATTIEDVADGLRHLDRQFRAMADGRFDDPSLAAAAPGVVGAYVQRRVEDLRRASGALRAEAASDPLTGLLNRRALQERIRRQPDRWPLAVLYLDLDRFKAVNDQHGHRHGDAVLQAVAARLVSLVRPDDLVARLGGDEFVLMVADLTPEAAAVLVSRVELALGEPIVYEDRVHQVGCSVGLSWLDGPDQLDRALSESDHAMLAVKRAHHDRSAPAR